MTLRIIDVFSGAGGLSLGWLQAFEGRARLIAAIDSDIALEPLYAWNFPTTCFHVYRFGNAQDRNHAQELVSLLGIGDVDVLLAGPPCQTLSSAGKRRIHADSWHALHVCDLVGLLEPKVVVIENVPEFQRVAAGRLVGQVRVALGQAGYKTVVANLTAASYGVPQLRSRCFMMAVRGELWDRADPDVLRRIAPTHDPDTRSRIDQLLPLDVPRLPLTATVSEAIGDLPSLSAGEGQEESFYDREPQNAYQQSLRNDSHALFNHVAARHSQQMVERLALVLPGESPQSVPGHPLRPKQYFRAAYARLDPESLAPTITTQTHNPGSGRFTHYRDNRVITVREAARLQSFPDRFRFFGPQSIQRRHVGNAVPPMLSRAIAEALRPYLDD